MKGGVIRQVGRYTVAEAIGEGSFGKVYKGFDKFDKSEVALKFISKRGKNKKELEGLRSQNEMLTKICHRNIIKLLGFLQTQNEMIIITQFAGENLADVLEKKKKFTYQQVRVYCKQIFDALCYLDQNRIAHRDLKPQNILLQNNVIKICDFGFARKLSASTTFMNSLKGTPLYIAPEILGTGPLNYTKKVDIWSFGIIIYELFSGRPPFFAENLQKLKPKILYEKVRFPKEMPVELRSLIDKMLQKNPESRSDWEELKKNEFFKDLNPLNEKVINTTQKIDKEDFIKVYQQPSKFFDKDKEEINYEGKVPKLNKMISQSDLEDIKRIQADLLSNKIEGKKLKCDDLFYEKIISIFSSYFSGESIVTKQHLSSITSILVYLLTKVKPNQIQQAHDITRRKQILFCAIKLTEQDSDPETISNQLVMIGFLIKNNFDNISIDFHTDQDILQICLRQIQTYRSHTCFGNSLTVLGTLASQGMITINNSEQFFIRIEKQGVLGSIAEAFEPIASKRIVLQCLQKFIHPNQFPTLITKNHHELKKAFSSMKLQVAQVLQKRNFLLYNPLTIYKQTSHVQSYAKILYQCINVSDTFRKEFLKNSFWIQFLQHKQLRIFCFAYDYICIQKDRQYLIPNQVMKGITATEGIKKSSFMENAFYLARAQFYLSKKQSASSNKQQPTLKLINEIYDNIMIDEQTKKKASRQVQGYLSSGQRIFEQVLGQTFCNILNDPNFDRTLIPQNTIQVILQQILNYKPEEQLRISTYTWARAIIGVEQLIKIQSSKIRNNRKILSTLVSTIHFCFDNSLAFQIQNQQSSNFTKKLILSLFSIIKFYSVFDEKSFFELYCKAEQKGFLNLLLSDSILDKNTLHTCLSILQRLSTEQKYMNSISDFGGITLIDKLKPYLNLDLQQKDNQIVTQFLHILSLVIKKTEQYATKIKQLDIISHFSRYLQHPSNQNIRHQTLTLIGNLAKHSTYFFDDFANHSIFPSVVDTVKRFGFGNKNKILKGIVYAVGNVSFYSDRFAKQFILLVPILYSALSIDDSYLVSNTISTISNLLRHSNYYLKALIQHKVIKKVIQIVMESSKLDNKMNFGLNMIKKVLAYPEVLDDYPKEEFISLYIQKVKLVGEDNECMKKIKALMVY